MKKTVWLLFLFSLICSSCGSSLASSMTTTTQGEKETMVIEKSFSSQDDSFEFFQSGWMTVNSKFATNSLRLIEDETHSMGPGMVRTPSFDSLTKAEVTLIFQPTGFNNVQNREVFVDKTFSFAVDFLLKENEE